jgi:sortase A
MRLYAQTVDAAEAATQRTVVRRRHRVLRWLGTGLILAGVAVLAWSFVVWRWNDPVTGLYTRWQQQRLDDDLAALVEAERLPPIRSGASRPNVTALIGKRAARLRARAAEGSAIGRIRVPRLGLDMVLVNGTDTSTLKKGPGRDLRTFMPGQHNLVYVAGHRTTYSAPFARIDHLRPGDAVTIEMPYATFRYRITSHQVVDAHDLSVLRPRKRETLALQACHPRFFATQRYIVWASPVRVTPRAPPVS